jgi:hypothetical protein
VGPRRQRPQTTRAFLCRAGPHVSRPTNLHAPTPPPRSHVGRWGSFDRPLSSPKRSRRITENRACRVRGRGESSDLAATLALYNSRRHGSHVPYQLSRLPKTLGLLCSPWESTRATTIDSPVVSFLVAAICPECTSGFHYGRWTNLRVRFAGELMAISHRRFLPRCGTPSAVARELHAVPAGTTPSPCFSFHLSSCRGVLIELWRVGDEISVHSGKGATVLG